MRRVSVAVLPWGVRLARVLVPLAALWAEGIGACVGVLLAQEMGFWLSRRLAADAPATAARLFGGAYVLRAVLTIVVHEHQKATFPNGALFQDDYTGDLVAEWLVRIQHGDPLAIYVGHIHVLDSAYSFMLAAIYSVLGYAPLVPKLINVSLAALSVVLVFAIARDLFADRRVSLVAGVLTALLPSTILWSIVAIREVPTLFCVLLVLRAAQVIGQAPQLHSARVANQAVLAVAALAVADDFRQPVAVLAGGALAAMLVLRAMRGLPRQQTLLVGGAAATLLAIVLLGARVATPNSSLGKLTRPDVILREAQYRRASEGADARTGFGPQTDIVSLPQDGPRVVVADPNAPLNVRQDVLEPLGFALFAPAPWQAQSVTDLAAAAEMLLWYALYACLLFVRRPRQPAFMGVLLGYGLAIVLLLALSEGNIGNLVRHRLMLTPTLTTLAAAGLVSLYDRLAARGWARLRWRPLGQPAPTVQARSHS